MSPTALFAKIDPQTGEMKEKRQPSDFPLNYNPRSDGREQLILPPTRRYSDVLGYSRSQGFTFPAHLRDWEEFKSRLSQSPRFAEVIGALPSSPVLGSLLNLLISSIDSLIRIESQRHLATFLQMWTAFKEVVVQSVRNGELQEGLVEEFEAIATSLNIDLESPSAAPAPLTPGENP